MGVREANQTSRSTPPAGVQPWSSDEPLLGSWWQQERGVSPCSCSCFFISNLCSLALHSLALPLAWQIDSSKVAQTLKGSPPPWEPPGQVLEGWNWEEQSMAFQASAWCQIPASPHFPL